MRLQCRLRRRGVDPDTEERVADDQCDDDSDYNGSGRSSRAPVPATSAACRLAPRRESGSRTRCTCWNHGYTASVPPPWSAPVAASDGASSPASASVKRGRAERPRRTRPAARQRGVGACRPARHGALPRAPRRRLGQQRVAVGRRQRRRAGDAEAAQHDDGVTQRGPFGHRRVPPSGQSRLQRVSGAVSDFSAALARASSSGASMPASTVCCKATRSRASSARAPANSGRARAASSASSSRPISSGNHSARAADRAAASRPPPGRRASLHRLRARVRRSPASARRGARAQGRPRRAARGRARSAAARASSRSACRWHPAARRRSERSPAGPAVAPPRH